MSESIWKKEIHLGRRRSGEKHSPVQKAPTPEVAKQRRRRGRRRQPIPSLPPSVLRILEENRAPQRTAAPAPVVETTVAVPAEPSTTWEVPKRSELWAPAPPPVVAPEPEPVSDTFVVAEAEPVSDTLVSDTFVVAEPGETRPAPAKGQGMLRRELRLPRRARDPHPVRRIVGLRVGSSHISAAHVRNNGSAELVQLARTPLEPGLVVNGEVREPVALAKALKAFFAANKLPRKDVRLGVASNRIGVRVVDVPAIGDPKQFENALRFRAQELLPIPVADAILDHVTLDEWTDEEGNAMRRVLLVFAHRELVGRFVEACRGAGVRLSAIDLDPFALLRAVSVPRPEAAELGDAVVAVAVGHDRTIVAVSDGRLCEFTRVLEWGGSSLDLAIAHALDQTPSQVEELKHRLALDGHDAPDGLSPVQYEAVKAAVRAEIAVLGRELVSSLRFYQSRAGSLSIGEVLLAGGTAQLGGLSEELQRALGATVRVADPFARVAAGKRITLPADGTSLAIAVGLGIED